MAADAPRADGAKFRKFAPATYTVGSRDGITSARRHLALGQLTLITQSSVNPYLPDDRLDSTRLRTSSPCKRATSAGSSDRNVRISPLVGCLTVRI